MSGTKCYNCNESIHIAPVNIKRFIVNNRKVPLCPKCSVNYILKQNLRTFNENIVKPTEKK